MHMAASLIMIVLRVRPRIESTWSIASLTSIASFELQDLAIELKEEVVKTCQGGQECVQERDPVFDAAW